MDGHILRKEWGFDGAVVTDWGGSNDHVEGVKNGSTLEMPSPGLGGARKLLKAVAEGSLTEQEIDLRVDEMLDLVLFTTAAMEKAPRKFDEKAHHELAQRAAEESIVLLKNEGGILPLKHGKKVALIGDFALTPRYQGAGFSMVNPICVESLKDAMERAGLNMVGYCAGYECSGKPNLNILFQYNMPLRGLAQMTGGIIGDETVDGLVMEAKGFWVIGILRALVGLLQNYVANSRYQAKLDEQSR